MFQIRDDTRPTMASWAKQIFELDELPKPYQEFLSQWLREGMPLGNITYIPSVHQYVKTAPECTLAWYQDKVMLLFYDGFSPMRQVILSPAEVASIEYSIRLLECTVTITVEKNRKIEPVKFVYNKTKEEQIIPILNILLKNPPDYQPNVFLLANEELEPLRQVSYNLFHTSKLCYRFDEKIIRYYWAKGKQYQLFGKQKEDPEDFLAQMSKGLVLIHSDFYGTQTSYLPWNQIQTTTFLEGYNDPTPARFSRKPKCFPAIQVKTKFQKEYIIPVLPEKVTEAKKFVVQLRR